MGPPPGDPLGPPGGPPFYPWSWLHEKLEEITGSLQQLTTQQAVSNAHLQSVTRNVSDLTDSTKKTLALEQRVWLVERIVFGGCVIILTAVMARILGVSLPVP